jgi:hypothetical protein
MFLEKTIDPSSKMVSLLHLRQSTDLISSLRPLHRRFFGLSLRLDSTLTQTSGLGCCDRD